MGQFKISDADFANINLRLEELSEQVNIEEAYDGVAAQGFSRCGTCGGAYNGNGCARNNCNGWD